MYDHMVERGFLCILFLILFTGSITAQHTIESVEVVKANVLQFTKAEIDIAVSGAFTNPYDASDIALDMVITTPGTATITLPCFFISGNNTASQWKARFAPREAGSYQFKIELRKNAALVTTSPTQNFTSIRSAKNGFVTMGDNYSFRFDSGKPFRAIGENVAWESRTWEDSKYTYDYLLTSIANNGANYYRTWMCAWNLPLEWGTVVNTNRYNNTTAFYHPQGIQRMDELVELSESLGLHMMLALEWHGGWQTGGEWNINPYNAANGGPANTPAEFFTSATAKARYKNKLRYLVARWGYSTSIGAWEFFNEVDNAVYNGTESTIAIPHSAITQWHNEMSAYLKSIDPYDHPVTTSVSHREISGLYSVAGLDFVQKHIYRATGTIPSVIQNMTTTYGKPSSIGEFGYDWDWNNINNSIGSNLDFDFKRGLWYGLFSPTPALPMTWWWEFFDERQTTKYFRSVRNIYDRMVQGGNTSFSPITVTTPLISLEGYGLKAGSSYYVYVLNNSSSASSNRTVNASIAGTGTFDVLRYDTETQTYTSAGQVSIASNSVAIPGLSFTARGSQVLILTPQGQTTGMKTPFNGNAVQLPGKIEAEEFDLGGEDVSYHDLEPANIPNQFRQSEAVDVDAINDGGFGVTNTIAGEWLDYSVNIVTAGTYTVAIRAASASPGRFRLQLNGTSISDDVVIPNTGGNTIWQTVTVSTTPIPSGHGVLRLLIEEGGAYLNHIEFTLVNASPEVALTSPADLQEFIAPDAVTIEANAQDADGSILKVAFYVNGSKLGEDSEAPFTFEWAPTPATYILYAEAADNEGLITESSRIQVKVSPSSVQSPYPDAGTPYPIPGKIEAENFDSGAEGIAYEDDTDGNIKGEYRNDTSVDLEVCLDVDGGYNLADIQSGEWVEYTIVVSEAGRYDIAFRVATQQSGQSFTFSVDGATLATIAVPNTGNWQTWKDVKAMNVTLPAGEHVVRLSFTTEFFNLNYMTFEKSVVTGNAEPLFESSSVYPNPNKGNFEIEVSPSVKQVELFRADGRKVFTVSGVRGRVAYTSSC
jgi:hypothetical protein